MVHKSTILVKDNHTEVTIFTKERKIHDHTVDYVIDFESSHVKVESKTFSTFLPYGRSDEITWRVTVCCHNCSYNDTKSHGNTSFNNVDKNLHFSCRCEAPNSQNITAECNFFRVPLITPLAIVGGVGTVGLGIAVGVLSLGTLAPVSGAMIGAGMSATTEGAGSLVTGTATSTKMLGASVVAGAAVGAFSGGVGALGESTARTAATTGGKLALRAAAGAGAGVGSKLINELKECSVDNKKWDEFAQSRDKDGKITVAASVSSFAIDAVVGAIGGTAAHCNGFVGESVSGGVKKGAARVAISSISAAGSSAVGQGLSIAAGNQETFNGQQVLTSTIASAAMSTAQEAEKNAIYSVNGGKHVMVENLATSQKNTDAKIDKICEKDPTAAKEAKEALKILNQTDPNDVEAARSAAVKKDELKETIEVHRVKTVSDAARDKAALNEVNSKILEASIQNNSDLLKQLSQDKALLKETAKSNSDNNKATIKNLHGQESALKDQLKLPGNSHQAHSLMEPHQGQFAADAGNSRADPRRIVFDQGDNGKFYPAGFTPDHNYAIIPQPGVALSSAKSDITSQNREGMNTTVGVIHHVNTFLPKPENHQEAKEKCDN